MKSDKDVTKIKRVKFFETQCVWYEHCVSLCVRKLGTLNCSLWVNCSEMSVRPICNLYFVYRRHRSCSASASAYFYVFLRSVVCLSVACYICAPCLNRSMDWGRWKRGTGKRGTTVYGTRNVYLCIECNSREHRKIHIVLFNQSIPQMQRGLGERLWFCDLKRHGNSSGNCWCVMGCRAQIILTGRQ